MSPTGRPHGPAWFDISTRDAAQARHVLDPSTTPASYITVFTDPDGSQIGLMDR